MEDEEDGPYRGKYLGQINSYHHQVSKMEIKSLLLNV